ncbi:MAG: ComEC/Rec2 family competence protein [Patescibacteria group bacterium]
MSHKVLFYSLLISLLLFSLFLFYHFHSGKNDLQVNFLDVGQGDSILIETPYGQNILIDGGPDDKVLTALGRNLPFWDRTVDLMVLTHPHGDHVTGLVEVLDKYKVGRVIHGGIEYSSLVYDKWKERVSTGAGEEIIIQSPQTIRLGENCSLKILYPKNSIQNKKIDNLNNSSLVSKLDCRDVDFLLTGDIESGPKKELVASNADLEADVLKLSHHGAREDLNGEFIEKVSPEIAVVSVGENDYGHPNEEYLQELRDAGIKVLRTDKKGTIIFTKNKKEASVDFGGYNWKDIFY